jgi:prepilin-type N-terminal cleavage/methylation domain-containing protein
MQLNNAGSARKCAFTLIELLIVVLIIAILAAIAIPNFLEFQMRAKVSRIKSDHRTISTGMEAYCVEWSDYPERSQESIFAPGGQQNYRGIIRLTTPIAYLTTIPFDPFQRETNPRWENLTYEMASTGCSGLQPLGWAIASSGPDHQDDFGPGVPQYPSVILVVTIYDPTNGTVSRGDIVRFGPGPFHNRINYL